VCRELVNQLRHIALRRREPTSATVDGRLSKSNAIHHSVIPLAPSSHGSRPAPVRLKPRSHGSGEGDVLELGQRDDQADPDFWCKACTLRSSEEE
jgi:hypothetical protein